MRIPDSICLAIILALSGLGCRPPTATPPSRNQLTLQIRTDPKGASVILDGRKLKATTPCEVTIDKRGHMLGVQYPGYEPVWRRIPPQTAAGPQSMTIDDLELEPKTVPVILTTAPEGAFASVDGQDRGTTPVFLPGLRLGEHEVHFKFKAGFAPVDFTINVEEGEPMIVKRSLESILGSVKVVTNEPECQIFIDGAFKGRTGRRNRSLVVEELEEGRHLLVVKKTGFKDQQEEFVLERQEKKLVSIPAMEQLPGTLVVISKPAGAKVILDGQQIGVTPMTLEDEPAGQVTLRLALENYDSLVKTYTVVPGMKKTVNVQLAKNVGSLSLVTQPPGCTVYIDGRKVGETQPSGVPDVSKPFEYDGLAPGRHTVRIEKAGFLPVQGARLIEKGTVNNIGTVKLKEKWLPTHILKTKNDNKIRKVKLLGDTANGYQVEYYKGKARITFEVQLKNISIWEPIE